MQLMLAVVVWGVKMPRDKLRASINHFRGARANGKSERGKSASEKEPQMYHARSLASAFFLAAAANAPEDDSREL